MATEKSLADLVARPERLEAVLVHRIPPHVDPPPDDWRWGGFGAWWPRPIPGPFPGPIPGPFPGPDPGDPVPVDISRFSRAQLELSLESIKAQRIRLDALEGMIKNQLKATR